MRVVLTGRLEKSRQPNSRASIGLNGNGAGKIRPTTNSGVGYKNVGRSHCLGLQDGLFWYFTVRNIALDNLLI